MPIDWENINSREEVYNHDYSPKEHTQTDRLIVPGGWVVRTVIRIKNAITISQIFVQDASHSWALT